MILYQKTRALFQFTKKIRRNYNNEQLFQRTDPQSPAGGGADSYTAAKRDFATRSGLIPRSALFDQKQLIEIYHCSVEVQAGLYSITDEQGKCLQSIIDQIELSIPNLGELLDQEQNIEAPEDGGMQFS